MDKRFSNAGAYPVEPVAAPRRMFDVVFARDDSSGVTTQRSEAQRILIVEDDYLVALQMETALTQAGFDIAGIASSADEALALAAAERPALAVVDIRLAGKRDGIDAAIELYARHGIRCVFASAHHGPDARERAAPARPLAWVAKPYTTHALIDVVRQALRTLHSPKA